MNTLSWNSEQLRNEFADCTTLRDAIQKIEKSLWTQGQVICRVSVNGMSLDEAAEVRLATSTMTDIAELTVCSDSPDQLKKGAIRELSGLLPKVEELTTRAADAFRSGQMQQARQEFSHLLQIFQYLTDLILVLRSDVGTREMEIELHQNIQALLKAFENQDFVLVADILEYDLNAIAKRYLDHVS